MRWDLWVTPFVFKTVYLLGVCSGKQCLGVWVCFPFCVCLCCILCSWWASAPCHSCSVAKSCPTLQPQGLPHARPPCPSPFPRVCPSSWTGDATRPSHPLPSPSPYAVSRSQRRGPFQRVRCLHRVDTVLELPDRRWSPCSLLWKHVVLATGLPGKSQQCFGLIFLKKYI